MKKSHLIFGVALAAFGSVLMSGCSVGMAPQGGSAADVKAAFDKMPMEEQVKLTQNSSMPADAKKQKLAEIYAKFGKTPPDDVMAAANTPSGPPPGVGTPSQGGR